MTPPLNTSRKRFGAFQSLRSKTAAAPAGDKPPGRFGNARRYSAWLRPHLKPLALVLILSFIGIGIDMVWPLVSAHLIDRVILSKLLSTRQKVGGLVRFALGMASLVLFSV